MSCKRQLKALINNKNHGYIQNCTASYITPETAAMSYTNAFAKTELNKFMNTSACPTPQFVCTDSYDKQTTKNLKIPYYNHNSQCEQICGGKSNVVLTQYNSINSKPEAGVCTVARRMPIDSNNKAYAACNNNLNCLSKMYTAIDEASSETYINSPAVNFNNAYAEMEINQIVGEANWCPDAEYVCVSRNVPVKGPRGETIYGLDLTCKKTTVANAPARKLYQLVDSKNKPYGAICMMGNIPINPNISAYSQCTGELFSETETTS